MQTTVQLTTEAVPLAGLLKLAGVVDSGGQAKHLVRTGRVRVDGTMETRRTTPIRPGMVVEIDGEQPIRITVE